MTNTLAYFCFAVSDEEKKGFVRLTARKKFEWSDLKVVWYGRHDIEHNDI
jgi:hypothetical protein